MNNQHVSTAVESGDGGAVTQTPMPDQAGFDLVKRQILEGLKLAPDSAVGRWLALKLGELGVAALGSPAPRSELLPVPPGFALVPLRMTRDMELATEEEGWQWADLLAAAGAVDDDQYETSLRNEPSRAEMREVLLANGFTFEDGCADLKDHVYEAAYAVLAIAQPALPSERVWPKEVTPEMIEAFKTSFKDGSISTDRLTCAILALLKAAPFESTSRTEQPLRDLLEEVRHSFTRDDDLPGDLLPRIDAALDSNAAVASVR